MADQQSVEVLEAMEQHFQRLVDLLTQADEALQQVKASNEHFEKAHDLNAGSHHNIEAAIADIENVLAQATNIRNHGVGLIREAKEEAQSREQETEGQ